MKTVKMLKDRYVSTTLRKKGDSFQTDDVTATMLTNGGWAKFPAPKVAETPKESETDGKVSKTSTGKAD